MRATVNKRSELIAFIRDRQKVSKAEIMKWGLDNYYISADRMIRHFVQEGLVRKIPKIECVLSGLKGKMAYYEWRNKDNVQELYRN